ncbi:hypothetical protein GWK47_052203 [Chionoecetes opilio]|uniref:Uncharacterized protein n=1 Tax=Chionoecetes opilio TaxID=41210 RepID=A0A8J4Y1M5_CHIOP|nr:hypothetical protein GWK47_052203 [Chionoecetes opilio]
MVDKSQVKMRTDDRRRAREFRQAKAGVMRVAAVTQAKACRPKVAGWWTVVAAAAAVRRPADERMQPNA